MTDSDTEKRLRTHTEKGAEMYEVIRDKYLTTLDELWKRVDISIKTALNIKEQCDIPNIRNEISRHFDGFCTVVEEIKDFYTRTNTEKSKKDLNELETTIQEHYKAVKDAYIHIDSIEQKLAASTSHEVKQRVKLETLSARKSHASFSSVISISSEILKLKAKAAAARVNMEFAEKEAALRKQNALLEEQQKQTTASLERKRVEMEEEVKLLSLRKTVVATEAEYQVLESEADAGSVHSSERLRLDGAMDPVRDTARFVVQQPEVITSSQLPLLSVGLQAEANVAATNPPTTTLPSNRPPRHQPEPQQTAGSDLTRFLLKKDLLLSRLTAFNDKAECFRSWKASFRSVMSELEVSPSEELDLLVKFLGPESSCYAYSIRSTNTHDPAKGLSRLWERLFERFGCLEMIDAALRQKIENFPKLSAKDNTKLYELCDILCEIEAAKEDKQFEQMLSFYDSSAGILPIVRKLPHGIQEKWTTHAIKYKKQHNVAFPPFKCFVEFIRETSRVKNNPSFLYETTSCNTSSRPMSKNFVKSHENWNRPGIAAKKTLFKPKENSKASREIICPLHKTYHSLNDCRAFRTKPLDERRKFIRDNALCFRCCVSTEHKMRDCKEKVVCGECGGDSHLISCLTSHKAI